MSAIRTMKLRLGMLTFIIRRTLLIVVTLIIVISATFFIVRLAPGGPFDKEKQLPDEAKIAMEHRYGQDRPILEQYGLFWKGLILRGDLGPSMQYEGESVVSIIKVKFPVSLSLGALALLLALAFGIVIGSIAAVYQNKSIDYSLMSIALLGISIPNFIIAMVLIIIFSFTLQILPVAGWTEFSHVILPAIALSLPFTARIARLMRVGMIEVLRDDFVRTAKAKGVATRTIVFGHCLPIAILPVISYLAPATAGILTGSLVIEQIFNVPGIGQMFVNSALNRDYFLIIGTITLYASLLMVFILISDVLYRVLDPRISYEAAET